MIGHRGAQPAPENTLPAFAEAQAQGAAWVECDVTLSAEGVAFLLHDETLDRTTSWHGPVATLSLAALRRLDAGSWAGARYARTRLPTLDEALDAALRLGLGINLEVKPTPGRDTETAQAVAALVQDRRQAGAPLPPLLLSSFSAESLAVLARTATPWPRALLVDADTTPQPAPAELIARARALGCCGLHPEEAQTTPALVAAARAAGLGLSVWTVNDPGRAAVLWDWGANAIISDHPARLLGRTG